FRVFFHTVSSGVHDGAGDRDGVSDVIRQRNVSAGKVPRTAILSLQLEVIGVVTLLQASGDRVGSGFVFRAACVFLCHRQSQTEASKQQTKYQLLHVFRPPDCPLVFDVSRQYFPQSSVPRRGLATDTTARRGSGL